jgi:hypothetical protein
MVEDRPTAETSIRLSLDSDPITGTLGERGSERGFSGYAELAAVIEAWRMEARESQPAEQGPVVDSSTAAV